MPSGCAILQEDLNLGPCFRSYSRRTICTNHRSEPLHIMSALYVIRLWGGRRLKQVEIAFIDTKLRLGLYSATYLETCEGVTKVVTNRQKPS